MQKPHKRENVHQSILYLIKITHIAIMHGLFSHPSSPENILILKRKFSSSAQATGPALVQCKSCDVAQALWCQGFWLPWQCLGASRVTPNGTWGTSRDVLAMMRRLVVLPTESRLGACCTCTLTVVLSPRNTFLSMTLKKKTTQQLFVYKKSNLLEVHERKKSFSSHSYYLTYHQGVREIVKL